MQQHMPECIKTNEISIADTTRSLIDSTVSDPYSVQETTSLFDTCEHESSAPDVAIRKHANAQDSKTTPTKTNTNEPCYIAEDESSVPIQLPKKSIMALSPEFNSDTRPYGVISSQYIKAGRV